MRAALFSVPTETRMSSSPSKPAMRWYKNPKFDAPELNSPQPCAHGAGCDYKIKDKTTGELVRGCCAFVHPGEEGTGRRLFAERTTTNETGGVRHQPACVRLTGAQNGFYERRGRRIPWPVWCEQKGIPYEANPPTTLGAREPDAVELTPAMKRVVEAAVAKALAATGTPATGTPATPPRRTHPVSPLAPTKHNPRRPKQRVDLEAVSVERPVSSTPTFDERTLDASQQSPSLMSSKMDAVD